ncbi:MAG: electron transfer flavoprotein subunit alpha [Candidatus Omnitrophica bacterium]|nr:electron transfer flavoprotein subunit alpha [Candidatus Omnitrophota bacterium]
MEKILFLSHTQNDGSLPKVALEALTAAVDLAKSLGAALDVGLIGENVQSAANSIGNCGAGKIMAVSGKEFGVSRYSTDAAAAEALAVQSAATIIVAGATTRFSRSLPGVAARLKGRIDTHVSRLELKEESPQIQRWYYRQRMVATLTRSQRPWILLLDSGVNAPWQGNGKATLEVVSVSVPNLRTEVQGVQAPSADAQTIRPDADVLLVAGAGWTKKQSDGQIHIKEAENILRDFLTVQKASLGSSKSLVDQAGEGQEVISFMSHLNQVGQTGSTPRHPKGLATCCHGEEPHVVGWRFINDRRAINLDPNCGWAHGKADVLYVADAFAVMTKVNELLTKNTPVAA